ncbi:MAG: Gfo/Idh/MocA family oxidoreductase [Clostridia bacterium]|nr:Gfo/Idh/MocA family oxidoreductase [Clostridia bacterium]
MMKRIRIGVVGGHRGRALAKLSDIFEYVEFAAACDIKPSNWYEKQWLMPGAFSDLFPNAVFYEDYDKMLDEAELDVVIVETGADIHAEFCIKALERNIHVLSDIPNVANLDEADRLWKAAEKSSAMISTGANPNEQKFTVLLQDFYNKGLLGKPYCMEAEYIHWTLPGSEENIHLNENGDWRKLLAPIRYCTHSLGPLQTILEEELRTVTCFGTGQQTDEVGTMMYRDDMMCAQFQTDSGVIVRLMRNGRCRANIGHHNYRVFGTEGYMERIDRFDKPVIRYNSFRELDTGLKEIGGEFMPPAYANNEKATGHGGMDYAMLDHFFDAVRFGKEPPISLRAGLLMTLPGIYAEESAKRGGQIMRMKYPWDEDFSTIME